MNSQVPSWRHAANQLNAFFRDELGCTGKVALHEPWITGNEWHYVKDCLDTGWVSSVGGYVDRFEAEIAEICQTKFAIAIVNGTSALHVALVGLGVGANDLVICPPLSFIGTVNAVSYCGAEPVFVDIVPETLGLDPVAVEAFLTEDCRPQEGGLCHRASGRRIAACLPVHIFGHPVNLDPIVAVCDRYAIPVLEDAAEAIGSRYKGRPCGSIGHAGVLSFNGNKTLTTGGGGMLVTNDQLLATKIKHLSTTAKEPHIYRYSHDVVGYNYRLPNINAALGCAQLERLNAILSLKRRLHARLVELFDGFNGVSIFKESEWADSNHWLNVIFLSDQAARDSFLEVTAAMDIQTRPCWDMLSELPSYRTAPRMSELGVARDVIARAVAIPSSPQLLGIAPESTTYVC